MEHHSAKRPRSGNPAERDEYSLLRFRKRRRSFEDPLADGGDVLRGKSFLRRLWHADFVVLAKQLKQLRLIRPAGDDHSALRHQQTVVQNLDPAFVLVPAVALVAMLDEDLLGP